MRIKRYRILDTNGNIVDTFAKEVDAYYFFDEMILDIMREKKVGYYIASIGYKIIDSKTGENKGGSNGILLSNKKRKKGG